MKQYWTDKLRRKLEGHRKAPPAGLWEGICEQMGIEPEPVPVRKPSAVGRWSWVAAAAAVLALAGYFFFYDSNIDNIENQQPEAEAKPLKTTPQQQAERPSMDKDLQEEATVLALNEPPTSSVAKERHISKQKEEMAPNDAHGIQQTTSTEKEHEQEQTKKQEPAKEQESVKEQEPAKEQEQEKNQEIKQQMADHQSMRQESEHIAPHSGKKQTVRQSAVPSSHKWSIGINASGGLLAAQTTTPQIHPMYDAAKSGNGSYVRYQFSSAPEVSADVPNHHIPIRFGLSLDYRLSSRLTLLSGVAYTYLYSEFIRHFYPESSFDQKLHYIGIPLGLAWQYWSSQHIQLYVSGGVEVDKCLNDKPWQLSTQVAAGAEYNLSRQFGIYVEPSIGYYFDDGTSLEHYYKKHPMAPSIEFGLRMHLYE